MDWNKIAVSSTAKPELTDNARVVLEKRYLAKDEKGNVIETPDGLFLRVARVAASADADYGAGEAEVSATATRFYEMMAGLRFMPNSPTLMNAGRPLGQLSACFVLPVEDSMDKIFESVKNMALIHKSGGGTGFSFSRLRPKNDLVKSTAGISGPVSSPTIQRRDRNREAGWNAPRVTWPSSISTIRHRRFHQGQGEQAALTNFNISVAITDEFMARLEEDGDFEQNLHPRAVRTVKARGFLTSS